MQNYKNTVIICWYYTWETEKGVSKNGKIKREKCFWYGIGHNHTCGSSAYDFWYEIGHNHTCGSSAYEKNIYLLDLFLTESNYLKKLCVTDSVYVDNFSYILRLNSSRKVQD